MKKFLFIGSSLLFLTMFLSACGANSSTISSTPPKYRQPRQPTNQQQPHLSHKPRQQQPHLSHKPRQQRQTRIPAMEMQRVARPPMVAALALLSSLPIPAMAISLTIPDHGSSNLTTAKEQSSPHQTTPPPSMSSFKMLQARPIPFSMSLARWPQTIANQSRMGNKPYKTMVSPGSNPNLSVLLAISAASRNR